MSPDAEAPLARETGFHPRTSELSGDFAAYRGFLLPKCFTGHGAVEEYRACRERSAVIDLSALRKFEVVGPDAETLLQHCLTRDVRRLAAGQVAYTAMCDETGGMIDDGTLHRLGPDNFRFVGNDDRDGDWLAEQAAKLGLHAWVRPSTDRLHNIAVQGPKSREILQPVVWTPPAQPSLAELQRFRFTVGRIGDFDGISIVVSRTGTTGGLGYEIWCHPRDAVAVWDAVWQAGARHGLAPMGLEALDILRIEAGLISRGAEFSDRTDPFEAGIGFTVPLETKEDDFIGRAALEQRKRGQQKTLAGLELSADATAAPGDGVHLSGSQVGEVTSAALSPTLGKTVALGRIDMAAAAPGTVVEVGKNEGGKRLSAVVAALPFYDSEKIRFGS